MTIHHRESFLNKIAETMGRSRRTEGVNRPEWSVKPQKEVLQGATEDDLVRVLEKQCEVIHTTFKTCERDHLPEVLKETVDGYHGKKIVTSNDERLSVYGLDKLYNEWNQSGYDVHIWDPSAGKENMKRAERADVGISFSDITLAESGTVTLLNNRNHGRSISLMPRTYVAIIPKSTLVPRMTQATRQIHENNRSGQPVSSCVSFVTGPSNSADIEMNLIVGVHGPVHVTYIVVDG